MPAMATTTGAAASTDQATSGSPTPPSAGPQPRSPPAYPDLCGRHRLQVEVQLLTREIGVLQDELQSVEGLQSVSSCCKEVHEYVGTNPDPLIPVYDTLPRSLLCTPVGKYFDLSSCARTKKRDKSCCFRRCLRTLLCFNVSWICCSGGCCRRLKRPSCCCGNLRSRCCHYPSISRCGCPCSSCSSQCCNFSCSCCRSCFSFPRISCPEYSCGCVWSCSKCTDVCLCSKRSCCKSQCLCQWT